MSQAGQPIWQMLSDERRHAVLLVLGQITFRRGREAVRLEESNDEGGSSFAIDQRFRAGQDPPSAPGANGDGVYPAVHGSAG